MDMKKVLAGRITKDQKIKLLAHMTANRSVALCKFAGPDANKKNKAVWAAIAEDLNAGFGACKSADQWRRCWIDWKAAVKRQYTAKKKFERMTGNLPASAGPKPINDLDAEVIAFFAEDTLEGDMGTREACGLQEIEEMTAEYLDEEALSSDGDVEQVLPAISTVWEEVVGVESPCSSRSAANRAKVEKPSSSKPKKTANQRAPHRSIALYSELQKAKAESQAQMKELGGKMDQLIERQDTTNELLRELIDTLKKK